jgi:acyl carrier protein
MALVDALIFVIVRTLLALRYRIRVIGLDKIRQRGTAGIVFLPNHPALIDPVIVTATLFRHFRPRALADKDQVDRPFVRFLARRVGVVPIPDIRKYGPGAKSEVEARVNEVYQGLKRDGNMLLYPSGHLYRTKFEDLRGNSGVETILREVPGARVVLVRTRGLWGSRLSMVSGDAPNVARVIGRGIWELLASFLFLAPKREVTLEFFEPDDLPRTADRNSLNAYIERYYNENAPPATYVPATLWERGGVRELPDPQHGQADGTLSQVPESVRRLVIDHLKQFTDASELREEHRLAQDLGLDSLDRAELALWIGKEFGYNVSDVDAIQTVGDVLLAARGEAVVAKTVSLKHVPPAWFAARSAERVAPPAAATIAEAFLAAARSAPGRAAIADQIRGVLTYRDLVTAILVLKPIFERQDGARLGIMLPASAGACITYLATVFAGKTPVLVNWTTGARNLLHALDAADTKRIITSKLLVERIRGQGTDLTPIADRFVFLEDIGPTITRGTKISAALRARFTWGALARARVSEHAAILFTSGSESFPKVVPLTHTNILTNVGDILRRVTIRADDALVGFLPPFHSFGLTVTMVLPLIVGIRAVYHANPTEAWVIAKVIETYKPTVILGTPTFLSGIVRASSGSQLASIRIAVTGAEKCPDRTYQAIAERCPKAVLIEGYGITECSPIVSATDEHDRRPGTIGQIMPSLEYVIVDIDSNQAIARPSAGQPDSRPGLLLVRGPSVFPGYIGEAPSPFVEHDGRTWYRTGDLTSQDAAGRLTFRGRLKRFVKLGGEMISLPAVEAVLEAAFVREGDEGPVVAVEATPGEDHPEIVLFTTREIDRATANAAIRNAGLSPLHNVSRVVRLDALPVLGTGKTDYRALQQVVHG